MEEVPDMKTWLVTDSVGVRHEFQAQGFNPAGDGRIDFFIIKQPVGMLIQSTEMMQKPVCSFYYPASIRVSEMPVSEKT